MRGHFAVGVKSGEEGGEWDSHTGDARLNGRAGAPTRASHALPSTLFSLLSVCLMPNYSSCFEIYKVFCDVGGDVCDSFEAS